MKTQIAFDVEKTRELSFQKAFPKTVKCIHCKKEAPLAFVTYDTQVRPSHWKAGRKGYYWALCHLFPHKPNKGLLWLHDLCAVAVYLCRHCLEATALINQG